MKRKNNKFIEISIVFILGVALGIYGQNPDYFTNLINQKSLVSSAPQIKHYNISELSRSKVSTCFTQPASCTKFIANQIDRAEESIYMQAYGISDALSTY